MNQILVVLFSVFSLIGYCGTPKKEYVDHPSNSNIKYEAVEILTKDSYKLKSWICYPQAKDNINRVLVLAYGDTGNMSYWLRQVSEMLKKGYTIVMFDYRGYGQSQAFPVKEESLYYEEFTTDLVTVLEYTKKRFKSPIGVWALSTGSLSATEAYQIEKYDYLITEGFMIDPKEITTRLTEFLKKDYILPEEAKNYTTKISKLTLPILLFTGDRDGLTQPDDSYRVSFLNPKSKVVMFKGGHLQGFQALSGTTHGQRYIEAIDDFYTKSVESPKKETTM
ncbi:MAG: alpha/beta hydrolase [Flavobacteriaceae bacterium]|jgi:pimeloyl-ACP methyl ester carboxylesterase|nr:alpha/beta hydrolase [Flavobacteriaceae bacterium]